MGKTVRRVLLVVMFSVFLFTLAGCRTGKVSEDCDFLEECNVFTEGLIAVEKNGRWGYVDKKGEVVIPILFDSAGAFHGNNAIVRVAGQYNIIDKKGNFILDDYVANITLQVEEALYVFQVGSRRGLMDLNGDKITEALYDSIGTFSLGLAPVRIGSKWGFIDTKGHIVIAPEFDHAQRFSEGLARVEIYGEDDDFYGYIDTDGELVIDAIYTVANPFDEHGNAIVATGDWSDLDYKLINTAGSTVVSGDNIRGNGPLYGILESTGDGWRVYDKTGSLTSTKHYSSLWFYNPYVLNVNDDDDWKILLYSTELERVVDIDEDDHINSVYYNGKWHLVYSDGDDLILDDGETQLTIGKYDNLTQRINQQFVVDRSDRLGIIDKDGEVLVELLYDNLIMTTDGYILFNLDGSWGVMDNRYNIIIPAEYDGVYFWYNV